MSGGNFFSGVPGQWSQRSRLGPEQQGLYQQLQKSAMGRGAGGAFGDAADYYRGLLGDNENDFNAFAAPEMRRFNEQIIPGLARQYGGTPGGLSSSAFRNSATNAGTDLSERLGALRAQLRQSGAQGLMNIGQQGLGDFNENIYTKGQGGLLDTIGPGAGAALGSFFGPLGTAAGGVLGKGISNWFSNGRLDQQKTG